MLLGFVYSAVILPKRPCQILKQNFRTKFLKNIKNIKMKPPVALFKRRVGKCVCF